jgi:hypothetical protein
VAALSGVSNFEVVAAAAVKKFREMISEYKGPPEGLRSYLLRRLDKMETRADEILVDLIDGIL